MFDRWGRRWECLRGYAVVEPAGWWLELRDVTDDPNGELVLLASWPDNGNLCVSQHRDGLLPEIVEWFTVEAANSVAR